MSEPSKDEAELMDAMVDAIWEYLTPETRWTAKPYVERDLRAAIRAAGWAVVPARLTKDMEYDALRAENARLRKALEDLLDDSEVRDFGEWFEARLKQACAALDPDGQKERRAKALAELAEMDADLLDIDPEVKLEWPPAGCIRIDSCEKHGECMYLNCVNRGKKAAPGVKL